MMKMLFTVILCMLLCLLLIGTSVAASANLPRVTKDPTDETVPVNGKCQFVTRYENAELAEWHFVSPDGRWDLVYTDAQKLFPTLTIINGYAKDMTLDNIPVELNGWQVYCRFTNSSGSTDSGFARITVLGAQGNNTPSEADPFGTTDYLSAYRDVLLNYQMVLKDELEGSVFEELGISSLVNQFYRQNPLEELGYSLSDLNNDGIPELIIGTVNDSVLYGKNLFDVYRLFPALGHWGPPVKIVESNYLDRWFDIGEGFLLKESYGVNTNQSWSVWRIDRNQPQPVFVEGILFQSTIGESDLWFSVRLDKDEIIPDQPLKEQEVSEWLAQYVDRKTRHDITPFAASTISSQSNSDDAQPSAPPITLNIPTPPPSLPTQKPVQNQKPITPEYVEYTYVPPIEVTPTPGLPVIITSYPTDETLSVGGGILFTADGYNIWTVSWQFVDPDGNIYYSLYDVEDMHPGLILKSYPNALEISNVPLSFNGWAVQVRFDGNRNYAISPPAIITVLEDIN